MYVFPIVIFVCKIDVHEMSYEDFHFFGLGLSLPRCICYELITLATRVAFVTVVGLGQVGVKNVRVR